MKDLISISEKDYSALEESSPISKMIFIRDYWLKQATLLGAKLFYTKNDSHRKHIKYLINEYKSYASALNEIMNEI